MKTIQIFSPTSIVIGLLVVVWLITPPYPSNANDTKRDVWCNGYVPNEWVFGFSDPKLKGVLGKDNVGVKIKFGAATPKMDYGAWQAANWLGQFVWAPDKARSKTIMHFYPVSKFGTAELIAFTQTVSEKSGNTKPFVAFAAKPEFIMASAKGIGMSGFAFSKSMDKADLLVTPVWWNENVAWSLRNFAAVSAMPNTDKNIIKKTLGKYVTYTVIKGINYDPTPSNCQPDIGGSLDFAAKIKAASQKQLDAIYIGSNHPIEALKEFEKKIVTTVDAWPSKD